MILLPMIFASVKERTNTILKKIKKIYLISISYIPTCYAKRGGLRQNGSVSFLHCKWSSGSFFGPSFFLGSPPLLCLSCILWVSLSIIFIGFVVGSNLCLASFKMLFKFKSTFRDRSLSAHCPCSPRLERKNFIACMLGSGFVACS